MGVPGGDTRSPPVPNTSVHPTEWVGSPPPCTVPARGHSLESRQGFRSLQWLQIATLVPASSHVTDRS